MKKIITMSLVLVCFSFSLTSLAVDEEGPVCAYTYDDQCYVQIENSDDQEKYCTPGWSHFQDSEEGMFCSITPPREISDQDQQGSTEDFNPLPVGN